MIGTTPAAGLDRRVAGVLLVFSEKSRRVESALTRRVSMAREPREREALRKIAMRQKQPDQRIRLQLQYFDRTTE
jgi:hypothetical protein